MSDNSTYLHNLVEFLRSSGISGSLLSIAGMYRALSIHDYRGGRVIRGIASMRSHYDVALQKNRTSRRQARDST